MFDGRAVGDTSPVPWKGDFTTTSRGSPEPEPKRRVIRGSVGVLT